MGVVISVSGKDYRLAPGYTPNGVEQEIQNAVRKAVTGGYSEVEVRFRRREGGYVVVAYDNHGRPVGVR